MTKLLMPYITAGVGPDWATYLTVFEGAGADLIEVGLPFSDPTVDGLTIQEASDAALARGVTPASVLAELATIRVGIPLIASTYANIALRPGFADALRAAGVTGLIVPDLPLDELAGLSAPGIEVSLLASPVTPDDRLAEIGRRSQGFVYAVSVMGTTGERDRLAPSAAALAARVKQVTDLPVLLGFGISTPEQAAEAAAVADGVIVGAAVMRRILDGAGRRSACSWRRCGPRFPGRSPCDDRRWRQSRRAAGLAERPDRRRGGSSMARYRAIAADLAAKIRDGHYAPGEALPAQRELSVAYGVTLMTLRQALQELGAEGLIVQRPGKGTFVAPPHLAYQLGSLRSFADDLREQGHEVRTTVIAHAQRRVPPRIAARLRVRETETGLRLERVRAFAGRRAIHQISWVREPHADRLREVDFTTKSLYAALADVGVVVARASETIRPEVLDADVARHLDEDEGAPVLVSDRVTTGRTGQPWWRTGRQSWAA